MRGEPGRMRNRPPTVTMRGFEVILLLSFQLLATTASAFNLADFSSRALARLQHYLPFTAIQNPYQNIDMSHGEDEPVLLSDVLPIDKQISIFSGFTRAVESVSLRMEDGGKNTTVLAPSNTAITNLPRKPWEGRDDEKEAGGAAFVNKLYEGMGGEDRAARNLRRFVEAHLVAKSPWERGHKNKIETIEGKKVWWDEENGVRKIYPDGITVITKDSEVSNGQVWVLDGVINY